MSMPLPAFFDRIAPQWEDLRRDMYDESVRAAVLGRARLRGGDLAVDVGAGAGFLTEALLDAGARVLAIDESAAMMQELARRLSGRPALEARQGDGARLPLAEGVADAAVATMYLHHAPDPAAALREMARVLRPGGRVVIADMDAHAHEWLRRSQADRWLGFRRQDVAAWLSAAGLVEVAVEDAKTSCSCSDAGRTAAVTVFVAAGTKPSA